MSPERPLFYDDWRDSLRYTIKALGGFEAVGADLWPAKPRKQAGAWLSDCLNPERAAKLDLEEIAEILRMGRAAGIHDGMHQLAGDIGYEKPEIAPQPSAEKLIADRMQAVLNEFRHLADEAEKIRADKVATLRRVTR